MGFNPVFQRVLFFAGMGFFKKNPIFFLRYKGPNLARSRALPISLIDDGPNELSEVQTTETSPNKSFFCIKVSFATFQAQIEQKCLIAWSCIADFAFFIVAHAPAGPASTVRRSETDHFSVVPTENKGKYIENRLFLW
jgi:hypothetical protein